MKIADIQSVAVTAERSLLGISCKAPSETAYVRMKYQVRVPGRKGRSQISFVLVPLPLGLCYTGALVALVGLESSTQASSSLSGSQQCNILGTKFCQGKDLEAVALI